MKRCQWADPSSELYIAYHDNEWGQPEHDDRKLFEMLTLESFQAGLSWLTILKKREAFRRAFDGFQPDVVAQYGPEKVEELMADAGIVRNRRKIEAAIRNAGVYLSIQKEFGSFDCYLWEFTDGKIILNIRFDFDDYYGGLHCGQCLDVQIDGRWVPTRIEMSSDWYLVGIETDNLVGLSTRI